MPPFRLPVRGLVEGCAELTRLSKGQRLIVKDMAGVNENTGETLMLDLGRLF